MASFYAKTAAEAVEGFINTYGNRTDSETFVDAMCGMHHTLQQKFTGEVVLQFIRKMAKRYDAQEYDARNEAACKICRLMYDAVKAEYGLADDEAAVMLPCI